MKKLINKALVATIGILALPISAQNTSAQKPQWIRDSDDYYSYYAFSDDKYKINAQMNLFENRDKNNKLHKQVGFRLVWSNKQYCEDHKENKGVITKSTYYVNNQAIQFNITCFEDEYVNIFPSDPNEGKKHLLNIFKNARGKAVLFIKRQEGGKDVVYNLPSLGFKNFYNEAKKATKSSL